MPRIDPLQLLNCLAVLLSPEGGILSHHEVPRLVNLMTKFSKKLVSKCVYILILKNTEQSLVNLFMSEGGWNLIYNWLQDAIQISNWDLVNEILTLLLVTPVDVERLKLNNIPKLVKSLSRLEDVKGVQDLSNQLVHDWLVIVKGSTAKAEESVNNIKVNNVVEPIKAEILNNVHVVPTAVIDTVDASQIQTGEHDENSISPATFYTVTVRDGKQVISKKSAIVDSVVKSEDTAENSNKIDEKESKSKSSSSSGDRSKSKSRSSSSSKHSSSSSSSRSKSSSSSRDKHKSSSSSSSKSSRDKDKHRSNGSKSSSSAGGGTKEKQAERDKDTLAKIKPQTLEKIGRIPKKSDDGAKKEPRKPTMSIEVRKNNEERPKTVKVFNSKRRSTGLEEEARPPPPRPAAKAKPALPPPGLPAKRPSPVRDLPAPPEKRPKIEMPERPGAIKLIPPKPKPPVLQESDIFMDALTASATPKKDNKKRKRRTSATKDTPGSPTSSQDASPIPIVPSSPLGLKNIVAPNFYQDTLHDTIAPDEKADPGEPNDENDSNDGQEEQQERSGTPIEAPEEEEAAEPVTKTEGGIKGVLVHVKRKGPKKSVKFNDGNLTQVRFFELDETERVNVTKTFMDMAKMEMSSEREALQASRKLPNEDTMAPHLMWRLPYLIDQPESLVVPGAKSLEKDIQFAREKSVLQALYFDKRKIPESAEEPPAEHHQMNDPITIPLEDAESQEMDLTNMPWPEPKGSPPPQPLPESAPGPVFASMPMPFPGGPFPPPPSFAGPRFGPPFGPNMMPNGSMMGPPPEMIHPNLNPNAFGPGPGPDGFNNMSMMNDGYPPMGFNPGPPHMGGGGGFGPLGPNNFMNRGGGVNRGGFRGRGGIGPWIRMGNGPPPQVGPNVGNWGNRGRGGGVHMGGGGRLCKNFKNHGFCRNDKCPFVHPK